MKDLTSLKTYIIDSEDPHEVDDAISLEIKEGNIKHLTQSVDYSKFRYTVDQEEDFLLVKQIVKKIKSRPIITKDIIEILNDNPDIQKINSKVKPKSLEQD